MLRFESNLDEKMYGNDFIVRALEKNATLIFLIDDDRPKPQMWRFLAKMALEAYAYEILGST
jgi:hypothetical protein